MVRLTTVSQLAAKLGKNLSTIRAWCARLGFQKIGTDYVLDERQVIDVAAAVHDRRGRPARVEGDPRKARLARRRRAIDLVSPREEERQCKQCGAAFTVDPVQGKQFCSEWCRYLHHHEGRRTMTRQDFELSRIRSRLRKKHKDYLDQKPFADMLMGKGWAEQSLLWDLVKRDHARKTFDPKMDLVKLRELLSARPARAKQTAQDVDKEPEGRGEDEVRTPTRQI